jgi:Na+-transporting NADH:ubiquinone oxidoreductase subunit NqrE
VIIETAEQYGVRSYIFIPCIVYGPGEGFGNKISIQTVAVVKAAKALGRVYDVNDESAVRQIVLII